MEVKDAPEPNTELVAAKVRPEINFPEGNLRISLCVIVAIQEDKITKTDGTLQDGARIMCGGEGAGKSAAKINRHHSPARFHWRLGSFWCRRSGRAFVPCIGRSKDCRSIRPAYGQAYAQYKRLWSTAHHGLSSRFRSSHRHRWGRCEFRRTRRLQRIQNYQQSQAWSRGRSRYI